MKRKRDSTDRGKGKKANEYKAPAANDKLSRAGETALKEVAKFLTPEEKESLRQSVGLFKEKPNERILKKFLLCVARGEQDKAEALLQLGNPSKWLLNPCEFTDLSGRTFKCTAYEYAMWSKDTHMRRMLERYMDADVCAAMLKRVQTMRQIDPETEQPRGLPFVQNGEMHHSVDCDLSPLKQAYKTYLNRLAESPQNYKEVDKAWEAVGKALKDVPAHVAQEYCRTDRPMHPRPEFNEPTLPRNLTLHDEDDPDNTDFLWFSSKMEMRIPFRGQFRGCTASYSASRYDPQGTIVRRDAEALNALDDKRTAELDESVEFLVQHQQSERKEMGV